MAAVIQQDGGQPVGAGVPADVGGDGDLAVDLAVDDADLGVADGRQERAVG